MLTREPAFAFSDDTPRRIGAHTAEMQDSSGLTRRELLMAASLLPVVPLDQADAEFRPVAIALDHRGTVNFGAEELSFHIRYGLLHFGSASACGPMTELRSRCEGITCEPMSDVRRVAAGADVLFVTGRVDRQNQAVLRRELVAQSRAAGCITLDCSNQQASSARICNGAVSDLIRAHVQQVIAFDVEDVRMLASLGQPRLAAAVACGDRAANSAVEDAMARLASPVLTPPLRGLLVAIAFGMRRGVLAQAKYAFGYSGAS